MAAALILISGLFLSGCSNMSSAATIGGTEISMKIVEDSIAEILAERAKTDTSQMQLETGDALNRSQLQFLITNKIIEELAIEDKITITQAEVDSYRVTVIKNVGGEASLPNVLVNATLAPSNIVDILRRDLIIAKLSQAAVSSGLSEADANAAVQQLVIEKAKSLKIVINPKFGKWNDLTAQIEAADATNGAVTP
jgi:SurA N-terminal domain